MDTRIGWMVVAAAFAVNAIVFGITYSFGVLFDALAAEFGTGRSATALVFSLTTALLFLGGLVTGPLADRYGPRPLLLVGAAIMSLGLLLTATVDSIWLGYLTYGLGVGLGGACTYVPVVATVGGWFDRHRTMALGLAVAGIGAGTMLVAQLTAHLAELVGFRGTCTVLGLATAVLVPLCALATRRAPNSAEATSVELGTIARSPAFLRLYLSGAGLTTSVFVVFVFLAPFARAQGLSAVQTATLVGLMGGASVAGRLILPVVGARRDILGLYRACFLGVGLSHAVWLLAGESFGALAAFAALFGLAQGGWIALAPAVAARLFGVAGLGRVLGFWYTAGAIGALAGPPVAGALIDATGGYALVIPLSGAAAFGSAGLLGALGSEQPGQGGRIAARWRPGVASQPFVQRLLVRRTVGTARPATQAEPG
jgi:MFS family permease